MGDRVQMERAIKTKSIRYVFISYVVKFCIIVIATVILMCIVLEAGFLSGIILPANHAENIINEAVVHIKDYSSYADWMPYGCTYAVYDEAGRVKESNIDEAESLVMWQDVQNGVSNKGDSYYKIIRTANDTGIIKYKLYPRYSNENWNKYLPGPSVFTILIFIVLFILETIILANRFTKRLNREVQLLKDTTDKIQMDNLEFQVASSEIIEINDVLASIDKMKVELKNSLTRQWILEEGKKKQISALVHDLKTPLTVIRGNAELIEETELNKEQRVCSVSVQKSVADMEQYLMTLMDIIESEKENNLVVKDISFTILMETIISDARLIAGQKNIRLTLIQESVPAIITVDETAIKRCLLNVISNAVEHTPTGGEIFLNASEKGKFLYFMVEDSGPGFSGEEMKSALEQFYQGEKSRNSREHYGLGLYIVDNLVKNHGGSVKLLKSEKIGGAKVEIKIPINH
ncbi:GHKL domain-containing protein [Acetobacterium paludosum]|uniref:histidine kinase n=2 Tax=Acetobacterium paludosum TaxID=52693 RepID=A0A923HYS2_9FIRM|nr:GHKL domain-containing protein [Acetobacterium paludosum]